MKAATGTAPEVLPLPKGGGAIRSIGETFTPDLYTGTGTFEVPIWCPRGPGGLQPSLRLIYSTAVGNGAFGMGWRLPLLRITRRTDRGVPTYDDARDMLLLDGEELVAVGGGVLRARVESQFRRVRRSGAGWEVTDRGGRRFLLGTTAAGRVEVAVAGVVRTVAWLVQQAIDTRGNRIDYAYRRDGDQLYVETITYGPNEVAFRYETRPDAFIERRAGFAVTTALRCTGVELRRPADAAPVLREYTLAYDECPESRLSLLSSIHCRGHPGAGSGAPSVSLPPLTFGWTPFAPGHRYRALSSEVGMPPSDGLDQPQLDLADLDGHGLPGVVEVRGPIRRYWPNRQGTWGPPRELRRLPAALDLSDAATALADMDGDGAVDVVMLAEPPLGYLRNEPGVGWTSRARFSRAPAVDPADPNVRLVDLDGDGRVDLLQTAPKAFYAFLNRGAQGWGAPVSTPRRHDLAEFPDLFLADPRVRLADMTGDGLIDLVWVHGGRLDYWPGIGVAGFGPRVSLALEPSVSPGFAPERLFLVDVNGDGAADVVYVERGRIRFWTNCSGRALAPAREIRHTPPADGDNVRVADMLGSGRAGLLWSFPTSRRDAGNYKYLELASGGRPYLLESVDNGIGMVTRIEYESSSKQALDAEARGAPWAGSLPFPVHAVTRIEQHDTVTGVESVRRIRYADGRFEEREFRGFGRAEVIEEGDATVPAALTVSTFHQDGVLKGRLRGVEIRELDAAGAPGRVFRREVDTYAVRALAGGAVRFPHLVRTETFTHERTDAPLLDVIELTYDDHGNPIEKRERWDAAAEVMELVTRMRYTADTQRWLLNLPVEMTRTDGVGRLLRLRRYHYDGAPFVGAPLGEVTRGDLTRCEEMVLTDAMATAAHGTSPPDFAALGLHRMTAPDGQLGWATDTLRQDFDAVGNVTERMDAFGNTGQVGFDADGIFATSVTDPLGNTFVTDYDTRAEQLARLADPNGAETRYRFDAVGRLVAVVKPGDSDAFPTTTVEHLDASTPVGVSTEMRATPGAAGALRSVDYYDGSGRLIQRRASAEDGAVLVDGARAYNARGWDSRRTVPFLTTGFGHVPGEGDDDPLDYTFAYEELGRVVETVTPDGRPARAVYAPGAITRFDVSDTDDSAENVAREHFDTPRTERFDARGRLLAVRETIERGAVLDTLYLRDALGQLLSVVDARGFQVASYAYDLLGRKIDIRHVDAGRRRAVYDARGDLVEHIDAEGVRVSMTYDRLRRIAETRVHGAVIETYTYDTGAGSNLVGRLAKVDDEAGEVEFSYTPRGLIAGKARAVGASTLSIGYAYDSLERVTAITYPDGSIVTYEYDGRGQVAAIPGVVDELHWNAAGQLEEARLANGTVESYRFDPATFYLAEAKVTGPARPEPYHHVTYAHDAVGNPLAIDDHVAVPGHRRYSRAHTFDALSRLTGLDATLDGAALTRAYHYDEVGNFRRNEELVGEDLVLAGGGSNQIAGTASGSVQFDYDGNGSATSLPGRALEFDARGRLVRVTRVDGTVVEFTYGYAGDRVRKRVTAGTTTTETLYVDDLAEVRAGQLTRFVVHGGRKIAALRAGRRWFLHPDHLGSVLLVTDDGGAIVSEHGYLPFGGPAFASSAAPARGFIGNELDADTGLVFCASRYYDPAAGRFISVDPFVLLNPERFLLMPGSLNLYVYAANNPVRLIDDAGTFWKWVLGGLIIAALVVATIVVGVFTGGAGFAFGILLAASIGSALGSGIGTYAAATGGGDPADGFLFGALVGGVGGAAGYAAAAGVAAIGIGGALGSALAGAAQGAVIGAANGAIIGYAGGAGSLEDIAINAGVGFLVGAVLGGVAGWIKGAPTGISEDFGKWAEATYTDPATGQQMYQTYATAPGLQAAGQVVGNFLQQVATATASPIAYASFGSVGHLLVKSHWDDIKAWALENFGGEDQEVEIPLPGMDL